VAEFAQGCASVQIKFAKQEKKSIVELGGIIAMNSNQPSLPTTTDALFAEIFKKESRDYGLSLTSLEPISVIATDTFGSKHA
jgi:hypothetical protein